MFGLSQRDGAFASEFAEPRVSATLPYGRLIDDSPLLLEQSYHLRYQVYCLERGFLPAEDYPDRREVDRYDRHSLHFGVVDVRGDLQGTIRLVQNVDDGLPMFRHCSLFATETVVDDPRNTIVEVSRLSMSRAAHGAAFAPGKGADEATLPNRGAMVLHLYRAVYQTSKRRGITHWLAATETSLPRLLGRFGFPFRVAGPEVDYFGIVAPHVMSIHEFDQIVLSGRIPRLRGFLDGLEPEFHPRQDGDEWITDGSAHPDSPAHVPAEIRIEATGRHGQLAGAPCVLIP